METQAPGEKPQSDFLIIISYEQKIQSEKINRQQANDIKRKERINLFLGQDY